MKEAAVQQPLLSNGSTNECFHGNKRLQQDQLAVAVAVRELLGHSHCELLLLESGS
jgi:hypothetical protein